MPCYTMNYIKSFTITDKIYGLYSDDDLRKSKYIWTNCDFHGYAKTPIIATNLTQEPTDPQYYFYAYYSPTSFNHVDISDKFCFRAAEAYLIKAEAEAYMGHEDAARQALNTLRAQRYAPGTDYAVTATGDDLIKTIRNERERELCLEGQRWFDLRRYRVCQVLPQKETITHHYYYASKDSDGSTSAATASARYCRRKRLSRTIIITTRAAAPPGAQPSTLSPSSPTTGDGCCLSRRKF